MKVGDKVKTNLTWHESYGNVGVVVGPLNGYTVPTKIYCNKIGAILTVYFGTDQVVLASPFNRKTNKVNLP